MSLEFYANRLGEDFVTVVIEASRREFSPPITVGKNEEILNGIYARDLATSGHGQIRGTTIVPDLVLTIVK